jgi:hypothetical protein
MVEITLGRHQVDLPFTVRLYERPDRIRYGATDLTE